MANNWYPCSSVVGGPGSLTSLNGLAVADGARAVVVTNDPAYPYNGVFLYIADSDSGASVNEPFVVAPTTNPGDLRWILIGFVPLSNLLITSGYDAVNYPLTSSGESHISAVYDGFIRGRGCYMAAAVGGSSKACAILSGEENAVYDAVAGFTVIAGGNENAVYGGDYNFIGGGSANAVYGGSHNVISGGTTQTLYGGSNNVLCGGSSNSLGSGATHAVICGGTGNSVSSDLSVVLNGDGNSVAEPRSAVVVGVDNYVSASDSFVGSGTDHYLDGTYVCALSGHDHNINGNNIVVCGGNSNSAQADDVFIGTGDNNYVQGAGSVLLTGTGNNIQGAGSVLLNGTSCYLIGNGSVICSGAGHANINDFSFIGPGSTNQITADNGFIASGDNNYVDEQFGFVFPGAKGRAHLYGQVVHSTGFASSAGKAQASEIVMGNTTTSDTPTPLFLDLASTEKAIVPISRSWKFNISLIARQTAGSSGVVGTSAFWTITGGLKRNATTTTTLIGVVKGAGVAQSDERDTDISAQGTITMAGLALADETFIVGLVTFTWKVSRTGAGEVEIGSSASEAVSNIISSLALDSTEVTATGGTGDTVIVTSAEPGAIGNSVTFTSSATNMSVDGSGYLGTTTLGVNLASTWSVAVEANDSDESLKITVTGETNKTIAWLASVDLLEVG